MALPLEQICLWEAAIEGRTAGEARLHGNEGGLG